ncbi:hypothetical protein R3P38DRAFT_3223211 [Favolaschia claudopus]|uniref:Uncharacterized protein n=1 Tax=Favolaschia claudopus TaxID=2862362 RepID=A0AAV9ZWZ8_9AGAR
MFFINVCNRSKHQYMSTQSKSQAFLPTPVMAKLKKQNDSSKDCEEFRPTRANRKSEAAKQATAEARKKRRREYYARDAEKIREKNRIHIAERRAAAKRKRSGTAETRHQASELTAAELAASQTLAQMQVDRAIQEKGGSGESEEAAVDREITALWEEGEKQRELESEDEESDNSRETGETVAVIDVEALRHRRATRIRRRQMADLLGARRLSRESPSPDPPSPEPRAKMPSLYTALFRTSDDL